MRLPDPLRPGDTVAVIGCGGVGLNVIQGLRLAGADMIIGVDLNNDRKAWGERFGMTHFVNPTEVQGDLVAHLVNMTKRGADQIGGADYTFDCTGNVEVMRTALESCHRGWGESIIIGVAGAGALTACESTTPPRYGPRPPPRAAVEPAAGWVTVVDRVTAAVSPPRVPERGRPGRRVPQRADRSVAGRRPR